MTELIVRQSLAREIANAIESWIFQEVIRPGERLRESHLAEKFGTSQGPIREALRILEERGLVRHKPNKGTRITELAGTDVAQILSIRIPLEAMALELARKNSSEEDKEKLRWCFEQLAAAADTGDLLEYHKAHGLFHRRLWRSGGNLHLADTLDRLSAPLWAFYRQRMRKAGHRALSGRRTHQPLLDYVTSPNKPDQDATLLVEEHVNDAPQVPAREPLPH